MATEKKSVITPKFRASFAHVFKPTESQSGSLSYRLTMLFDKTTTDIAELKGIVREAVESRWPDKEKRPKALVNPIKDGDTDRMQNGSLRCEKYPEMKGCWVVNSMSMRKPQVVDQNVQEIIDPNEFYSGCYARASVNAFTYAPDKKNPSKKYGVGVGLNNVQKMADGERFAGGTKAKDDFAPVEGADAPATAPAAADDDMFA